MSTNPLSRLGDPKHTLYLVDVSSFIFRAFFAIRSLTNKKGEPTNAVYGVATMMARLVEDANPNYLAIVYDSKEPSFRKEIYPEYKANRSAPPDDLIPQFEKIENLISCMGMHSYRRSGVEADDLIGTLTKKWCKASPKNRVVIVTGDKDLMQLVNERVVVWDTMKNEVFGVQEVEAKFGVLPTQIRDYLALIGDSSDNIPGVPSIGPKSAVTLLKEYHDLDGILAASEKGKISGKKGDVIKEHRKDALLSAKLASLEMDLPVELDIGYLKYEFRVSDSCVELLKTLDFHSLVTKWQNFKAPIGDGHSPARSSEAAGEASHRPGELFPEAVLAATSKKAKTLVRVQGNDHPERFRTIHMEKDFEKLLEGIKKAGEFGFDVETTSLNPRNAELVGIAICYDRKYGCYIPLAHKDESVVQLPKKKVLAALKPFLESPKYLKIGQNLKYDWSVMASHGICMDGIADTMVAAYNLAPEGRHNLETLAAGYLNYNVMTFDMVCEKGGCFDDVGIETATRYSAEDAWVAVRLWDILAPKLEAEGLMQIYRDVDIPLIQVLAKMERQGVCIDEDWLAEMSQEFEKDLKRIEKLIEKFSETPINLNSPKQLAQLLFEKLNLPVQSKTKTGYSTDAKVLEALAPMHECPRLLLEYREISKLKGTYVDPLPLLRDEKDHRIHASFHQTVAATGRLSSSDPNLQNIPIRSERGRKIRRAFVPSKGNVLIAADYSQIELRLLAHMSGDQDLTASFLKNEDVHQRTASEIFSIAPKQVDDRQRGIAKAINFGLMYGKTPFGLAQELKISRTEAQEIITKYFQRYSGVKRYLDQQIILAKEQGYVTTVMGRKRFLPDIRSSNQAVRQNAERMAMNSPIQGTAADLMKVAMIDIDRRLQKEKADAKLIIQVHDEVVIDCPKSEVKDVEKLVVELMENAMKLSVPLRVNAAHGTNWMDL